jgi:hypothetical protein
LPIFPQPTPRYAYDQGRRTVKRFGWGQADMYRVSHTGDALGIQICNNSALKQNLFIFFWNQACLVRGHKEVLLLKAMGLLRNSAERGNKPRNWILF